MVRVYRPTTDRAHRKRPPCVLGWIVGGCLAGVRLSVLRTVALDDLQPGPESGFREAVEKLRSHGAEIVDIDAPEVAEAVGYSGALFAPEAYATWGEEIEANPAAMFEPVRERFRATARSSERAVHLPRASLYAHATARTPGRTQGHSARAWHRYHW